ncbi:hypothetical protein BD310DRAFT_970352 [Dichomitus squalens]|uniref:Uncharacterized protein n=1 Tax=Dichomitus squalens TaxID=114155 RepID=A0A4Q9PEY1_9APHY|nr:hypothetical protein BD310DRAFT_970352 [Dichomitus squalens]
MYHGLWAYVVSAQRPPQDRRACDANVHNSLVVGAIFQQAMAMTHGQQERRVKLSIGARLRSETLSLWRHRRVVHFLAADRAILALIVASSRMLSRTMVAAYSGIELESGRASRASGHSTTAMATTTVAVARDQPVVMKEGDALASAKMRSILSQAGVCTRTPSRARTIMLDVVRARGVHPMLGGSFANLAGGVCLLDSSLGLGVCMIWEKRGAQFLSVARLLARLSGACLPEFNVSSSLAAQRAEVGRQRVQRSRRDCPMLYLLGPGNQSSK